MAGLLADLADPAAPIPSRLVIDANIVIDWLLGTGQLRAVGGPNTLGQARAVGLIERIGTEQAVGLVTSIGLNEICHFVLMTAYRTEIRRLRDDPVARRPDVRRRGWEGLFKERSGLVRQVARDLDAIRTLMDDNGLVVLQPDDLGPIPSGRLLEDELIRTMARYELDSNDAAILVEARRAGIMAIATADSDFRRAALDFDVYTWTERGPR